MGNNYHTIASGIVRDALFCLGREPLPASYIGGGMSLQFTLPEETHRVTADVDLTTSIHTSPREFREYIARALDQLQHRGYVVEVKKSRSTLDAHVRRDDDNLMVQLPRRNSRNFTSREHILRREVDNARTVEYAGTELKIITYEDLMVHKAIRGVTFMKHYGLAFPTLGSLDQMKEELDSLKKDFDIARFAHDPTDVAVDLATIRLFADVYDIHAVLTHFPAEVDEAYLSEAFDSFSGDKSKLSEWKQFMEKLE